MLGSRADRSEPTPLSLCPSTPFQVENYILKVKREHSSWGARKIRERLLRRFSDIPWGQSVNRNQGASPLVQDKPSGEEVPVRLEKQGWDAVKTKDYGTYWLAVGFDSEI